MAVYVVAPHLLWAKRWAEEQFRAGALARAEVSYSVLPTALADAGPGDMVYLVNPVMCRGEKWALVKEALALSRAGKIRVAGASTGTIARFLQRMQADPRHIPYEPKLDV